MNFSQLHERVRLEVLGRVERGVITVSLLARKTGLQQPHISNFLRNKRRLSLTALDRVLAALELSVAELLPAPAKPRSVPRLQVPIVAHEIAMHDEIIRPVSIAGYFTMPSNAPAGFRGGNAGRRLTRDRFVAIILSPEQATPMAPLLAAHSLIVLDRHAAIPASGSAQTGSIYAVRRQQALHFCHLSLEGSTFMLRPHVRAFPVELLPVPPDRTPAELVVGRVCFVTAYL